MGIKTRQWDDFNNFVQDIHLSANGNFASRQFLIVVFFHGSLGIAMGHNLFQMTCQNIDIPLTQSSHSWRQHLFNGFVVTGIGIETSIVVVGRFGNESTVGQRSTLESIEWLAVDIVGLLFLLVIHLEPIGLELSLSLGRNQFLTTLEFAFHASGGQKISSLLGNMNHVALASRFHTRCRIDSISKELETGLVTTQNTGSHGTTVNAHTNSKITSIGTKCSFQHAHQFFKAFNTLLGKQGHDSGVVLGWFRQPSHGHITISNSLHLEDLATTSNDIKGSIHTLEQSKDLSRFSDGTPRRKTSNIGK
mmetsp:Transcript_21691/g.53578  ORF Transcript_21691/g.53578 Transcript_21691/m.53578 type:complete len:306 (+) Transcript_21691:154-1071(+)